MDDPGTEDLKPYITAKDKQKKWLFGTVGMDDYFYSLSLYQDETAVRLIDQRLFRAA